MIMEGHWVTLMSMRHLFLNAGLISITAIGLACGSQPPKKNTVAVSTPDPPLAQPERIEKPVNVSFSTYSKEWPINWEWIDPDEARNPSPHNVKSGVLQITVPTGKDFFGDNRSAPRYLKSIHGDFQIETRVRFLPKENYQGAGILIFRDDNNYLRFERAYGGMGGGGEGIRLDVREAGIHRPIVEPGEIQTDSSRVELRVIRSGGQFAAYYRVDENSEWREAGVYDADYPETLRVGILAVNTAREVAVEFEYIRLLPGLGK